jgi:ribonuclease HI
LLGLAHARTLGASEVEIIGDSELIARQITGAYKVKHDAMRTLHRQARAALTDFGRWSIRTVPRAQNARADALVNAALDGAIDAPLRRA